MNPIQFSGLALRLRLALLRAGPVVLGAIALLVLLTAGVAWLMHGLFVLGHEREALQLRAIAVAKAAAPGASHVAVPMAAGPVLDNLAAFHATLGQRRHAEQQLKTLFGLAAKNGLVLSQGEYKSGFDRNAQVHTYQVNLPVKGSYAAIWQFALAALRAMPYAALDDISFRRDSIGDAAVEARLRITFYLSDAGSAP
jgi:hypothetical protein